MNPNPLQPLRQASRSGERSCALLCALARSRTGQLASQAPAPGPMLDAVQGSSPQSNSDAVGCVEVRLPGFWQWNSRRSVCLQKAFLAANLRTRTGSKAGEHRQGRIRSHQPWLIPVANRGQAICASRPWLLRRDRQAHSTKGVGVADLEGCACSMEWWPPWRWPNSLAGGPGEWRMPTSRAKKATPHPGCTEIGCRRFCPTS